MEENPPSVEQDKSNSTVHSKTGLIKFFSVIIAFLLLLGILNYFNILSVSRTFPSQLGWLPKQAQKANVVPVPGSGICRPYPQNFGKTNCQKAVEIALADTKGEIKNVALGPLQLDPALKITFQHQNLTIPNRQVWLVDIKLTNTYTSHDGKVIKFLRIQIPVDGSKAIYRKSINL